MDSERFRHLQDLIGYDNERMARMLNIDLADVEDFSAGRKPVPEKLASELEFFADWAAEVGDTAVKRDLARKHLGD
jgi:hypothetical protein